MISVGIDVSKGKSMVYMLKPYGEVRVIMEATGAYHLPLLVMLKQYEIFVSIINPLLMKKYASTALRKGKTDKMDSVRIANYGIDNWFKFINYSAPEEMYI